MQVGGRGFCLFPFHHRQPTAFRAFITVTAWPVYAAMHIDAWNVLPGTWTVSTRGTGQRSGRPGGYYYSYSILSLHE